MSDETVTRNSRSGSDDEGFKRELVQLIPHLRAFARTLCGDPAAADDLAQDAMMNAWDARAPWREVDRWGRESGKRGRGEADVPIDRPTLLWLRVRAPRFPRSGIASLRADYVRHTVAVERGAAGGSKGTVQVRILELGGPAAMPPDVKPWKTLKLPLGP